MDAYTRIDSAYQRKVDEQAFEEAEIERITEERYEELLESTEAVGLAISYMDDSDVQEVIRIRREGSTEELGQMISIYLDTYLSKQAEEEAPAVFAQRIKEEAEDFAEAA